MSMTEAQEREAMIREGVAALCSEFPGEYWRELDREQEYPTAFVKRLSEDGWLGALIPEEYGGGGLSALEQVIIAEEFTKAGVPSGGSNDAFSIQMVGNTIIRWGTEEQKKHYLPRILSGADLWCQGYSEPNAGSDLSNVQTKAVLDGARQILMERFAEDPELVGQLREYLAEHGMVRSKVIEGKVTEGAKRTIDADGLVVAPGFVDPHNHPTHEFYYVTAGRGLMTIDGEEREIRQGDLVHIPPMAVHSLRPTGDEPIHCFCFAVGVKGAGESGTVGAPPAIIGAIVDALKDYGVVDIPMPATAARVWEAMKNGKAA